MPSSCRFTKTLIHTDCRLRTTEASQATAPGALSLHKSLVEPALRKVIINVKPNSEQAIVKIIFEKHFHAGLLLLSTSPPFALDFGVSSKV